jgi:hypothetical protein
MQAIIYPDTAVGGTGRCREVAAAWLERLKEEAAGYYSAPHGAGAATAATTIHHGVAIPAGFVPPELAFRVLVAVLPALETDRLVSVLFEAPGYASNIIIGGWMTSAGNLTLVAACKWTALEYRSGRRHGLRRCYAAHRWDYLETQAPESNPDYPAGHHAADAV